ncbi:Forkhead domain [Nakaseomyces glabratus]|nr:Pre-rRNA-processing protein fhl1 [Nakaseomyces glabratus]
MESAITGAVNSLSRHSSSDKEDDKPVPESVDHDTFKIPTSLPTLSTTDEGDEKVNTNRDGTNNEHGSEQTNIQLEESSEKIDGMQDLPSLADVQADSNPFEFDFSPRDDQISADVMPLAPHNSTHLENSVENNNNIHEQSDSVGSSQNSEPAHIYENNEHVAEDLQINSATNTDNKTENTRNSIQETTEESNSDNHGNNEITLSINITNNKQNSDSAQTVNDSIFPKDIDQNEKLEQPDNDNTKNAIEEIPRVLEDKITDASGMDRSSDDKRDGNDNFKPNPIENEHDATEKSFFTVNAEHTKGSSLRRDSNSNNDKDNTAITGDTLKKWKNTDQVNDNEEANNSTDFGFPDLDKSNVSFDSLPNEKEDKHQENVSEMLTGQDGHKDNSLENIGRKELTNEVSSPSKLKSTDQIASPSSNDDISQLEIMNNKNTDDGKKLDHIPEIRAEDSTKNEDKNNTTNINAKTEDDDKKLDLPDALDHDQLVTLLELDDKHSNIFEDSEMLDEEEELEQLESEIPNTKHNSASMETDKVKAFNDIPVNTQDLQENNADNENPQLNKTVAADNHIKVEPSQPGGIIKREESVDSTKDKTQQPVTKTPPLSPINEEDISPNQHVPGIKSDQQNLQKSSSANQTSGSSTTQPNKESATDTPASIINEKNSLLYPKRQNSLTPMVFQPHQIKELIQRPPNADQGNVGSNTTSDTTASQPTIFAYARLDFESFTFYVQTLHAIIGRRSENDYSHKVDVNLGPSKSISRRHAQIFYNFGTGRFELSIIGKNGAFVDDTFVERGNTVPLKNKTKIQIGQIPFQFILPEPDILPTPKKNETKKTQEKAKAKEPMKPDPKKVIKQDVTSANKQAETKPKPKQAAAPKPKKVVKSPKKVYTPEEIPPEYREKPSLSYSAMLTVCIRKFSKEKGMSLSEIYAGIRELYPYFKYCPDGWQSSVRHNLSLNKSFRKISKEGKGWLWGLDEEFIAERDKLKQQQNSAAASRANTPVNKVAKTETTAPKKPSPKPTTSTNAKVTKKQNISQTLAANRATSPKNQATDDHQRTMKYLQEQLVILTKDRKGLSKQVIANILTQALAMTINQVTQAAKNKGISGNPLTALMDKNPQHLNLILAAAVNAATAKITNGEVKQLVNLPSINQNKPATQQVRPTKQENKKPPAKQTTTQKASKPPTPQTKAKSGSSFDPTSLSKFFQPKQAARTISAVPTADVKSIPAKRTVGGSVVNKKVTENESSSSSGSSSSEDDSSSDDSSSSGSDDSDSDSSSGSDDSSSGESDSDDSDSSSDDSNDESSSEDENDEDDAAENERKKLKTQESVIESLLQHDNDGAFDLDEAVAQLDDDAVGELDDVHSLEF